MPGAERGVGRRGRRQRLSRSADFDRVYREGRSHANRHLVVYAFPRDDDEAAGESESEPRLGISVGRKVGGAVQRNRVKRLLREAFWSAAGELPEDHDFVVVARPSSAELAESGGEQAIEDSLRDLLRGAGLAQEKAS